MVDECQNHIIRITSKYIANSDLAVRRHKHSFHYAGPQGNSGTPGPPGPQGQPGTRGENGDRGQVGLQGSSGPPGYQGDRGSRGPPGSRGPNGDKGSTGSSGSFGTKGKRGPTGPPGYKKQRGTLGFGQKGERGEPGYCSIRCHRRFERHSAKFGDSSYTSNLPGVVYTQWGASICQDPLKTVYSGTVASSPSKNYLCLPLYHDSDEGNSNESGVQIKAIVSLNSSEIPCSECLAVDHNTVLTIPGETTCPPGWTKEYHGYLMTGYSAVGQHYCMDGRSVDYSILSPYFETNCNLPSSKDCNNIKCALCTW